MTSFLASPLRRVALAGLVAVALVAASVLALAPASAPATAQDATFSEGEREAIGTIVREYLLENPEVMLDVFAELERRQAAEQEARQRSAVAERGDDIFRAPHDVVIGNPEGDVTLVEFFDYNCGPCRRAMSDVMAMIEKDPNLRVVLKDFPILGAPSLEAAQIGVAAAAQMTPEQALRFHMDLLSTRGQVDGARARQVAEELGLDLARIQQELNGPRVADVITTNLDLANAVGITGTPGWVVGDGVLVGAIGEARLTEAVANARDCGAVSC
ncbi:DsbA family protein [Salinarimonas rosea]|uniref:DsbA family protein n=1 Tax=Salinarimonas rosea TaxID=552063 RepID=UPI000420A061|nr:DsbA family protein [Salinarimonas rosea]